MHRTSSVTLGLTLFTITIRVFQFLFIKKPTPVWPLFTIELHSKWPLCKVVKHSPRLLTSPIPTTSHTNLASLSSSSSSCMYSYLIRVLTL